MKRYLAIVFIIVFGTHLNGQVVKETISGRVSYVSSQNIYVKFTSTSGITAGDTLFSQTGGRNVPVLLVKNLSSTSCVCSPVGSAVFSVADVIIARVIPVVKNPDKEAVREVPRVEVLPVADDTVKASYSPEALKQVINGSISVNTYLDNSNTGTRNSQRFRYTLSLDAENIAGSRFSFESYISFRHKAGEWHLVKNDIFEALKIYSLSARYDLNKNTHLSIGRRINPVLTSIGAMDGLQFDKSINKFSFGIVAGTRPDFNDYGFNLKLFQTGAYIALKSKSATSFSETSLAFMQQMNNRKTDRRFLYLQHSSSVVKNLYIFSTLEADLFQLNIDTVNQTQTVKNTFSLTGLYVSLSYRAGSKLSFSGSYDARKNIMYYETYKSYVDRVLENELRQGFRVQASYRIARNMTLGLQSGYRFLKSDPHASKNLYSYFTYSQIPGLNMSATLSVTILQSGTANGKIFSLDLSQDWFKSKVQAGIGYRYVNYTLPEVQVNIPQHMGEASLYWQMTGRMSFSVNYEGTFEKQDRYNRVYLQIRTRF